VADSVRAPFEEVEEDFGEVLRHELNNPLTGILGNAELLLVEVHRNNDGKLPREENSGRKPLPLWPCVCAKRSAG